MLSSNAENQKSGREALLNFQFSETSKLIVGTTLYSVECSLSPGAETVLTGMLEFCSIYLSREPKL